MKFRTGALIAGEASGRFADEVQIWAIVEHAIIGDERKRSLDGGGGDPQIAVVDLLVERMPNLFARHLQAANVVAVRSSGGSTIVDLNSPSTLSVRRVPHPARRAP